MLDYDSDTREREEGSLIIIWMYQQESMIFRPASMMFSNTTEALSIKRETNSDRR